MQFAVIALGVWVVCKVIDGICKAITGEKFFWDEFWRF